MTGDDTGEEMKMNIKRQRTWQGNILGKYGIILGQICRLIWKEKTMAH